MPSYPAINMASDNKRWIWFGPSNMVQPDDEDDFSNASVISENDTDINDELPILEHLSIHQSFFFE